MWLLSKAGLLVVTGYIAALFVGGTAVERYVTDPLAIPIWGWLLSLPGSAIVGTPGHIYYAVAFNCVILYVAVALISSRWRKRSTP